MGRELFFKNMRRFATELKGQGAAEPDVSRPIQKSWIMNLPEGMHDRIRATQVHGDDFLDALSRQGLIGCAAWALTGRPSVRISEDLAHAFALTDAPKDWALLKFPLYAGCLIIDGDSPLENPLVHWGVLQKSDGLQLCLSTWDHYGGNHAGVLRKLRFDGTYQDDESHKIVNFFFNAICYMNECGIETWGDYIQRARRHGTGARKGSLVYSMPVDLQLRKRRLRHGPAETGATPNKRFVVRGHWRQQRVGSRSDTNFKLTWIKPYWKGPSTAEVVERVYTLGQSV